MKRLKGKPMPRRWTLKRSGKTGYAWHDVYERPLRAQPDNDRRCQMSVGGIPAVKLPHRRPSKLPARWFIREGRPGVYSWHFEHSPVVRRTPGVRLFQHPLEHPRDITSTDAVRLQVRELARARQESEHPHVAAAYGGPRDEYTSYMGSDAYLNGTGLRADVPKRQPKK